MRQDIAFLPGEAVSQRHIGGLLASQFDMNYVEQCGLVKFDFLGLKTLTVIDTAVKLVNRRPDVTTPVRIETIPLNVKEVYQLISRGDTWGVFQLESSGFQSMLKDLKPDCFEDIIAAVALYRPGPMEGGMIQTFIECKHGRQEIVYFHPSLETVLKETYGVIVYQEQVMQCAQILAGYSLGQADLMRRAMGKKKATDMAKERARFVSGCEEKGLSTALANDIFDKIDKFAGYGFNKSHSAAYALIAYQTAWLKTHYPVEFLAALLTCDREVTEKIAEYIHLGKERGIDILPPDINESEEDFSVRYRSDDSGLTGRILFGLGAIKGVGAAALGSILDTRKERPFASIFDFAMRVDLSRVNKNVIESLIRAGAFDGTIDKRVLNRGHIAGVLETALERGKSAQKDRETGQTSLFGAFAAPAATGPAPSDESPPGDYSTAFPWSEREILNNEKAALGLFMSGHPMERYEKEAARLTGNTTLTLQQKKDGEEFLVAGIVTEYSERKTKAGKRMGIGVLEDLFGRAQFLVFSTALDSCSVVLNSTEPLLLKGRVMLDNRSEKEGEEESLRKISVQEASYLHEVRSRSTREVHLFVDADAFGLSQLQQLKDVLARHGGRCDAFIKVRQSGAETTIRLPEQLRLAPTDELVQDLNAFAGVSDILFR